MPLPIFRAALVGAAFSLAFATSAFAQGAPVAMGESAKGAVLVDAKGMTLYTFDKDTAGKSACNGDCAVNWPPLMAAEGAMEAGDYSVITRDDGSKQWAYKGKPLYTWIKDVKPGDITGDNFKDVWHVVQP
jgi:predicted lipoprotein with Yx(FWY)xxD motif